MSDFIDCSNFGLRVSHRLTNTPDVINTDFVGEGKADKSQVLIESLKGQVDYIVTQVFIPE